MEKHQRTATHPIRNIQEQDSSHGYYGAEIQISAIELRIGRNEKLMH
jgi:hypothetical protein